MLTVYVDFKSLASYLALKPTLALASRHCVAIDWRPFLTWERDIPEESHDAALSKRHHEVRLASLRRTDKKYAALQGIELHYPEAPKETDLALGALALMSGDKTVFVQAAFDAYWRFYADLNNKKVVSDLLHSAGHDLELSAVTALAALAVAQDSAEEGGVIDAPCFTIASQVFVGRQHLPWIEECLVSELAKGR